MKIRLPLRAVISIFLIFTVSVSVISIWAFRSTISGLDLKAAQKINEISQLVEKDYYFKLDDAAVEDALIAGYVGGLGDKYAKYYNPDASSQQTDAINGNAHGIGIIAVENKTREIYVYKVYRDSPADLAGIKAGDCIVDVGKNSVKEIGFSKAIKDIQSAVVREITLTIRRGEDEFNVKLKCADIDMQSVYSYVSGNIGILQIIDFNKKTYPQFKAEVDYLMKQNVKGIIFDLRHNTGGTVETAAKMLDYLLPECNTVHIRYKDGKIRVRNKSDKEFINLPFSILTDSSTASSSEIFASVMREQKKAVIIGSKTYGKSLIQRTYSLKNGSKVKFTIGEFIPESGVSYSEKGIEPDIKVESGLDNNYDYYFLTPENDKVLKAALDYMNQLS